MLVIWLYRLLNLIWRYLLSLSLCLSPSFSASNRLASKWITVVVAVVVVAGRGSLSETYFTQIAIYTYNTYKEALSSGLCYTFRDTLDRQLAGLLVSVVVV